MAAHCRTSCSAYAQLLRSSSVSKSLVEGKRAHQHIITLALEHNDLLRNLLIQLYGTCGALEDARALFAQMQPRDNFAWNFMIAAYTQHGQGDKGLELFEQMKLEAVIPDKHISVSVLSACASETSLIVGKQVHVGIMGSGFEGDVIVGNALLNMYGKCGRLEDANRVFNCMAIRNTISWNAMITASAHHMCALQLFAQMQQEGITPNTATVVLVLSVCANLAALDEGKRMHTCLVGSGLELDVVVGTALVNLYGKCGSLDQAQSTLDKMPDQNICSWNSMIAACAQHGQSERALRHYGQMLEVGIMPNTVTYVVLISAWASQEVSLIEGKRLHCRIEATAHGSDVVLDTALLNMYSSFGRVEDASFIFHKMPERNMFSWNVMSTVYARHGLGKRAVNHFTQMQCEGQMPDKITLCSLVSSCASEANLDEGKRVHVYILICGLESDISLSNALITMYGKCGSVDFAKAVFDNMSVRDTVSWTAMIAAYAQHGQAEDAFQLFFQMKLEGVIPDQVAFLSVLSACASPSALVEGKQTHACIAGHGFNPGVVMENALLNLYCKCGNFEHAQKVFTQMPEHDKVSFVSILSACAIYGHLAEAKRLHHCILDSCIDLDVDVGSALVTLYGKCGSLEDAQRAFDNISKRDVISWNAIFAAHAQNGQDKDILYLFDQMQQGGVVPDEVTFVSILSACSRAGLIDDCCHYFESMSTDHGITPTVDHYNCMVDLLGRAGQLHEAEDLITNMPCEHTAVSWMTLLSACRKEGDIERGERAAKHVFELDPVAAAPYVVLSNIFATAYKENGAIEMES